jgi:UTP--glucose-1-phosphate uridylyltransferase
MQKVRKVVIPAAGFGTRFLPATKAMPKEMIPIIDKPVIHYGVEEALGSGITDVIFVTGRGKHSLEDYFDYSYELEDTLKKSGKEELHASIKDISEMADIVYVRQKEALGLGHAILKAKNIIGDEPFAIILPDVLVDSQVPCIKQLIDVYEKTGKSVIAVKEVPHDKVSSYGIVKPKTDGNVFEIEDMVEKPKPEEAPSNLSILGRYVLSPKIFKYLEETQAGAIGEIQLTDALVKLMEEDGLMGVITEGDDYDCGDKLGFLKTTVALGLKNKSVGEDFKKYLKDISSKIE